MELTDPTLHQKLIEMCDCYMETDYLPQIKRMANVKSDNVEEDAIKFLALAIMYSISEKARKLSFKKKHEKTTITVKGEDNGALPTPQAEIFDAIMATMKKIIHMEEDKADMMLSLGLKNDSIDIRVKMELEEGKEKLKFQFPSL